MKTDNLILGFESVSCWLRQSGWICSFTFLALAFVTFPCFAQTSPPAATATFKELNRFGNPSEVDQSGASLEPATPTNPDNLASQTDANDLPRQSYPNADRIDSIHERINLLKQLIQNERVEAEAARPPASSTESESADAKDLPETDPENSNLESALTAESQTARDIDETAPPAVNSQDPGRPVVGEPVDSFELANSLFLTGNFSAARKSYEARLKEDATPEDVAWLKCLVGCCYRLEGNFTRAEEMFRDVTNQTQNSYPVDYSKWCLQYVAKRRASLAQFQAIETEIDAIVKKADRK